MILLALQHWFSKTFIKVTVIRTKCINSRFVMLQRKSIHHNALAFPLIEVVIWFKDGYYPFFTQSHHIYTKDIDQILCFVKVLREREIREKKRERETRNLFKEIERRNVIERTFAKNSILFKKRERKQRFCKNCLQLIQGNWEKERKRER